MSDKPESGVDAVREMANPIIRCIAQACGGSQHATESARQAKRAVKRLARQIVKLRAALAAYALATPAPAPAPAPAPVDAAGLVAELDAICNRLQYDPAGRFGVETIAPIRKAITALAAAAEREAALVREMGNLRAQLSAVAKALAWEAPYQASLAKRAEGLMTRTEAAEARVTAAEARERGISHADLCRLSRVFCNETWATTEQDVRIDEWLKTLIIAAEARAAIRKETR